jgi:hypothetical protein
MCFFETCLCFGLVIAIRGTFRAFQIDFRELEMRLQNELIENPYLNLAPAVDPAACITIEKIISIYTT